MTFLQAYLTASAWTGPDSMLPVDQCVATLHSPLQIWVCVYLYVWLCTGVCTFVVSVLYKHYQPICTLKSFVYMLMCVCSHLSHPWVLFHFGHGTKQAWRGRRRWDLQDATKVGGVDGGLLRVEQRGLVLLPLGGQVQLLSCPRRRKEKCLRLKLNLEKPHARKFLHKQRYSTKGLIDFKCLAWPFWGCAAKPLEITHWSCNTKVNKLLLVAQSKQSQQEMYFMSPLLTILHSKTAFLPTPNSYYPTEKDNAPHLI